MTACAKFERVGIFTNSVSTIRSFLLLWHFFLQLKSGFAQPGSLFVFGDSYADTGNAPLGGPCWRPPYGLSWPGYPHGRFSDGRVKTDVLAEVFGIQSPPPYSGSISPSEMWDQPSSSGGINFAVAGSGVMQAFASPTLEEQVHQFADYVEAAMLGPDMLKDAVVFVSVSGNDYGTYDGASLEDYLPYVSKVVNLIEQNLRRLYHLGIRNFMVSSVAPLSCLPAKTIATGYTSCPVNHTVNQVTAVHNQKLKSKMNSMLKTLKSSNFIYLDQTNALSYILTNPSAFGLTQGLRPCCDGFCGVYDFHTCNHPEKHLWWDVLHPTQAGWRAVVNLYYNHSGFTVFSPSLKEWVHNLGIFSEDTRKVNKF